MKRVIGVGDSDIDIYLDVDHIPGRDEKMLARKAILHPGGMVANFLVALGRLGTPCIYHGPLGNDDFGRLSLQHMKDSGVDTSGAVIKPKGQTYFCTVMLDPSGEKALIVAPTDCLYLQPEDVSEELIAAADHLHTTAVYAPTSSRVVQLAKRLGLTTSMDIEADQLSQYEDFSPLFSFIDVVFVNQRAALMLTNAQSLEEAGRQIVLNGSQISCITMGSSGSIITSRETSFHANAYPVEVVDSTGAGDCFAAGFVHGFLQGWELRTTARFASAVGAMSVTHRGGSTNTPSFNEVLEFLAEKGEPLNRSE